MDAVQYQMEVLSGEIVRLDEVISKIEEAVQTCKVDLQATMIIRNGLQQVLASYSTTEELELGVETTDTVSE
jgi:hypothetical protein